VDSRTFAVTPIERDGTVRYGGETPDDVDDAAKWRKP
jgi:hypothetical protein